MLEINHFTNGALTPTLAFIMSVIGSVLAMRCEVHARSARWPGGWLLAAAVALGGCGIWVMHFTAMLGFSITGATIRYDLPMTLASALLAVVVVWIGLSIAVRVQREWLALPLGGGVTGLGVAGMHYLGMYAMHSDAGMSYNMGTVALSILIAVVAATAALWFILHVRGLLATLGAALIMGVAVCGMHYTGMASLHTHHMDHAMSPDGVEPVQLLTPLIMIVTVVTMGLIVLVGLAELDDRSGSKAEARETPAPAPAGPVGLMGSSGMGSGRDWPRAGATAGVGGRDWPRAGEVRPASEFGLRAASQHGPGRPAGGALASWAGSGRAGGFAAAGRVANGVAENIRSANGSDAGDRSSNGSADNGRAASGSGGDSRPGNETTIDGRTDGESTNGDWAIGELPDSRTAEIPATDDRADAHAANGWSGAKSTVVPNAATQLAASRRARLARLNGGAPDDAD